MKVGCPKEIKPQEFRVGLTPVAVRELVGRGHVVTIETNAGLGAGFVDSDYVKEGAAIVGTAKEVFDEAEMIFISHRTQNKLMTLLTADVRQSLTRQ